MGESVIVTLLLGLLLFGHRLLMSLNLGLENILLTHQLSLFLFELFNLLLLLVKPLLHFRMNQVHCLVRIIVLLLLLLQ